MNRKLIYTLTLFSIVALAIGMFAFAGVASASAGPAAQTTAVVPTIQVTINPPAVTQVVPPAVTAVVPVTGADQTGPNILTLLFYGFLGLLAIVLLVALFASANRTTYIRRSGPPPPPDDLP